MKHRWVSLALVAALHLLLLAALLSYRHERPDGDLRQRSTSVRLILPKADARRAVREQLLAPVPRPVELQLVPPPAINVEPSPAANAGASTAPTAPTTTSTATTEPDASRSALRLALPPGYGASGAPGRNPALIDPRSNSIRVTLEDRVADAAGNTGRWAEEHTTGNRTLMRRGDTCKELLRSRIEDVDPFNGNVAPRSDRMEGQAYKCK